MNTKAAQSGPNRYETFVLSAEELAYAFAELKRPDLGHEVLSAFYQDLTPDSVNLLLHAAGRGLFARNLCEVSQDGELQLSPTLRHALAPMLNPDFSVQVGVTRDALNTIRVIYVHKESGFVVQTTPDQGLYTILCGSAPDLPGYLADLIDQGGASLPPEGKEDRLSIPLSLLAQLQEPNSSTDQNKPALVESGWPEETASRLLEISTKPFTRVSLFRFPAPPGAADAEGGIPPAVFAVILRGDHQNWAFAFPSVEEHASGWGTPATQAGVLGILEELIQ